MDALAKLEGKIEKVVLRFQELEGQNEDFKQRNADLSQEITRLKLENENLKTERQSIETSFGEKETEVKNRLNSLLSQVEQVELEMN